MDACGGGCSSTSGVRNRTGGKGALEGGLPTVSLSLVGQPAPAFGHAKKHLLGDQVARGLRHGFGFLGLSAEIFWREDIRPATISTNKWLPNLI